MPKSQTSTPRIPKNGYRTNSSKLSTEAGPSENGTIGANYQIIAPAHFELKYDGSIAPTTPEPAIETPAPQLILQSDAPFLRIYQGNSLEILDAIYAKYGDVGRFDCIFADPPYFLSNGGISCHAGKMVKVDKGDWDKSQGPKLNHEFNIEWLKRCQRVLKPNGTIWVSGTHHVIFSIGYAMQQLGFKILNDIAWEKPNPPPNLSCRYFTHSTETILWAAKNEKSKHLFNYDEMRKVTGKQMKTVWRKDEFLEGRVTRVPNFAPVPNMALNSPADSDPALEPIWTMTAPSNAEKLHGKHPTQKPIALIERCLLAATNPGDTVLDPFLGGGTTAVACVRLKRACIGIELDAAHAKLATTRTDREIIILWLREFRVNVLITVTGRASLQPDTGRARHSVRAEAYDLPPDTPHLKPGTPSQIDLDLYGQNMDRINRVKDGEPKTECIFHETKFVFLSCASVSSASVVHTTVDVSLQEAWAKTPTGKLRETTHVVRCVTEILRIKSPS